MGIYLPNMELPKDKAVSLIICSSGTIYYDYLKVAGKAVSVQPHGRLIDADAMEKLMSDTVQGDIRQYPYSDTQWEMAFKWIDHQPTIIPAEEE